MSVINPSARLYEDMLTILKNLTIKYNVKAEKYETQEIRSKADRYVRAYLKKDNFFTYQDYRKDEYIAAGIQYEGTILEYINNQKTVPVSIQQKMLDNRRKEIIENYVEENEYYRILNGIPPLDSSFEDYLYVSDEYSERYGIPKTIPIHEIEDRIGKYYVTLLEASGYIDELIDKYPDKLYLQHLGTRRIPLDEARNAKNFSILYYNSLNVMDSVNKCFRRIYDKCREYFVSTCYIHEYCTVIEYYDNFIALCIFLMTMQHLSVQMIPNAVEREFYDNYAIQVLYETYGLPFNKKIDDLTQKMIAQNVNLLIQNKACDKVLLDVSSILGFESVNIYEYYLMKERLFDKDGKPIFLWTKKWDDKLGDYVTVPDYVNMYDLHFQRVNIVEENVYKALSDKDNRIEYLDLTINDPLWWEDDKTYSAIWEDEFNYINTKYIGVTIPYRMSEMIFQSVLQFHMIFDKREDLDDVLIRIPKISEKEINLMDAIVLLSALLCKKYNISGYLTYAPSQIIHILQLLDRDIEHSIDRDIEILKFNFESFDTSKIEEIREFRIKEEFSKLTEEEIQELYDENKLYTLYTEYVEDEQVRREIISLMKEGVDQIPGLHHQIEENDEETFIHGESNRIYIGKFLLEYKKRIEFVLNSKRKQKNYWMYFTLEIEERKDYFIAYLSVTTNNERTKRIVERFLTDLTYQTSFIMDEDGGHWHDIDLEPDGTQNLNSFRKLRNVTKHLQMINQFYFYLLKLSPTSLGVTKKEKIDALNELYKNMKEFYYFISFRMTETQNYNEFYALKKLYDTAFYSKETKKTFELRDKDGNIINPETFLEYLEYKNKELFEFVRDVEKEKIYDYIDHIIYNLSKILDNVDNLYILNDGVSPLQELLIQLIEFFKSYTCDMVKLSSIMKLDMRMENLIKMIDHPQYIGKTDLIKDMYYLSYSDFIKKFSVKFIVESYLKFYENMASHTNIDFISSDFFLHDNGILYDMKLEVYRVCGVSTLPNGIEIGDGYYLADGTYYSYDFKRLPKCDISPEEVQHRTLLNNNHKLEKEYISVTSPKKREAFWDMIKKENEKRRHFMNKELLIRDPILDWTDVESNITTNNNIEDMFSLKDDISITYRV